MSPADLADLRRQSTITTLTSIYNLCEIMPSTAFLCVICAICGRITRKSTQSIYTKKPQCLSLIPLMIADETQNNTNYKKYFSANKCSLLHSLCDLCVICERITRKRTQSICGKITKATARGGSMLIKRLYKTTLKLIINNNNCRYSTLFVHLPQIIKYDRKMRSRELPETVSSKTENL